MNLLRKLAAVVVALSPMAANADLIDVGDSTIDDSTGLEWLDLTLTTGQGYDDIIAGFGGFAAQGYVHAKLDKVCELWGNAAAGSASTHRCLSDLDSDTMELSQGTADLLLALLGTTYSVQGTYKSNIGIFDSGLISSGIVGLACVNAGPNPACFGGPPTPNAERQLKARFIDVTNNLFGHYLVRAVSVPEPGTLALFGIGLAAMGLARRKRKLV